MNNKGLGLRKTVNVTEKAQETSYLVAEVTAKNMKHYSIAEPLMLPSCCAIMKTLFWDEAEEEV